MEKPATDKNIDDWKIPDSMRGTLPPAKQYLASMGIYIFDAKVMEAALDNSSTDFGKEIIPDEIAKRLVVSYMHQGYWEDIGTIRSFYDANINLTTVRPEFDFYDEGKPIYTAQPNLPPSKLNHADIHQSITGDGCIITGATIRNSIIGERTVIETGAVLDGVVCMGADFYANSGIGKNCTIIRTIIDKNARIGENCRIGRPVTAASGNNGYDNAETETYKISDGIVVIKKDAVIPAGTVI